MKTALSTLVDRERIGKISKAEARYYIESIGGSGQDMNEINKPGNAYGIENILMIEAMSGQVQGIGNI